MKIRTLFCVVMSLLLVGIILFACSSGEESPSATGLKNQVEKPVEKKVVIHLPGGDWGYPSPYAHYPRGPGGFKMALIFDSLLERNEKGLIPWLAESYEISPDGKSYLFKIRKNVLWHDGTQLTAEDVRFSFDYGNRHPMVWSQIFDAIEAVTVEGDDTVRITVKTPSSAMLYNLGIARIIPKHIWQKVDRPKEFTGPKAVIGSGPYRLTHYNKEHGTYRFEAFKKFWGPKPRVFAIEYIPVSEEILAYEKGEIDLIAVSTDLLPRFESSPEHIVRKSPAFWGYRLVFNLEKTDSLKDVNVRRALVHAIDKDELVQKAARGAGVAGRSAILPPDHVMATSNAKEYGFDPEAARRLLIQAGYKDADADGVRRNSSGDGLSFSLLCGSQEVRVAEILRQRLGQVGIGLKIISKDGKTRDSMVSLGEYQLAIIGHGGWGGDPDYLAQRYTDGTQGFNLSPSRSGALTQTNPKLLELLKKQSLEFDREKRKQLVYQLQALLADFVPEIPLFYTTSYSVYRPKKYDGWQFMFDHHSLAHGKLSYLAADESKNISQASKEKKEP